MQQDASRKLGFGASRTMQVAQRLYQGIDIEGETSRSNNLHEDRWN